MFDNIRAIGEKLGGTTAFSIMEIAQERHGMAWSKTVRDTAEHPRNGTSPALRN
ncbi:hypothetical protein ACFQ07_05125 [Actinomadura adrarensis]|uniref:Uncharacterized protein n=1 Tax=Actinomadura adrarensis TaxID=1819600 RepID=A0ABW3CBB6_9ACTN